jgi:uncharacterized membrane protein YgdD (TMEM256/DUF423 family)
MNKPVNFSSFGAAIAGIGVALGAFGAHGLRDRLSPEFLEIFKTATYYLMIHALALILFTLSGARKSWPGYCFLAGIAIFSGSLYALVFTGIKMLGAITPIGGVLFIAGWIGFAALMRRPSA